MGASQVKFLHSTKIQNSPPLVKIKAIKGKAERSRTAGGRGSMHTQQAHSPRLFRRRSQTMSHRLSPIHARQTASLFHRDAFMLLPSLSVSPPFPLLFSNPCLYYAIFLPTRDGEQLFSSRVVCAVCFNHLLSPPSATFRFRPSMSEPLRSAIAFSPASFSTMSTNA